MKKIGFYGYPPDEIISEFKLKGFLFIDLDVDFGKPDLGLLPKNTCVIIKNIINNAMAYQDEIELIIATTGEDKCDNGRFAAYLLKQLGFEVLQTTNINEKARPIAICDSNLPLKDKIDLVMKRIVEDIPVPDYKIIQNPSAGFWGVPPNDFSILELFPEDTAVFGWVRAVEAGVPASFDMEVFVKPEVKTVFFVQSFCSKGMLAKYLAEKHNGLFIDMEKMATQSIKAKIEAFLRLK